jgi:hypothetical protein
VSNPLQTPEDYELFVYTLTEQFPSVRRGSTLARVAGELFLAEHCRLVVRERLVFDRLPGIIEWYGYEAWQRGEKLHWDDSQPHPADPLLQSTHPHHKHIPPDMKHHRIPAPDMRFNQPNLPVLIRELESFMHNTKGTSI